MISIITRYAYTKVLHTEQKLMPIETFVLYFGEDEWKAPLSLMDILDIPEGEKELWNGLDAFSGNKSFEIVMSKFRECEEKEAVNTMCLLIAKRLLSVMEIPMVSEMTGLSVKEVEGLAMEVNNP